MQDAFLTLWRTASRFVPERGKASTWILTLVHRRSVDLVRREEHRRTDALDAAPEGGDAGVEEEAMLRLQRERVQTALKQLPDQQREALELAYYGGFTQSELAERLGQPLGTIKSRMFSGLCAAARAPRRTRNGDAMDLHELSAAYALDALDSDERESYEAHLAGCEDCQRELATLSETAGLTRLGRRVAGTATGAARPHPRGRRVGAGERRAAARPRPARLPLDSQPSRLSRPAPRSASASGRPRCRTRSTSSGRHLLRSSARCKSISTRARRRSR